MIVLIQRKKLYTVLVCCLLILSAPVVCRRYFAKKEVVATSGTATTNWGLKFNAPGEAPVGNASSEYLKQYDSYFIGDASEKKIYLTFDCGYEKGFTPGMLDVLKKHNVSAGFFVVGNFVTENPELVKRMVSEGHVVGNHTYHHPDMSKIADMNGFQKEIQALEEAFQTVTGQEMEKFYRPPQGKFSESNLEMAKRLGYKTVFWSLAYVDWYDEKQPTHEEAFGKLIPRIHPGAVVLLHNTSKTNSEILDELLTKWEEAGYTFGSIREL